MSVYCFKTACLGTPITVCGMVLLFENIGLNNIKQIFFFLNSNIIMSF